MQADVIWKMRQTWAAQEALMCGRWGQTYSLGALTKFRVQTRLTIKSMRSCQCHVCIWMEDRFSLGFKFKVQTHLTTSKNSCHMEDSQPTLWVPDLFKLTAQTNLTSSRSWNMWILTHWQATVVTNLRFKSNSKWNSPRRHSWPRSCHSEDGVSARLASDSCTLSGQPLLCHCYTHWWTLLHTGEYFYTLRCTRFTHRCTFSPNGTGAPMFCKLASITPLHNAYFGAHC